MLNEVKHLNLTIFYQILPFGQNDSVILNKVKHLKRFPLILVKWLFILLFVEILCNLSHKPVIGY